MKCVNGKDWVCHERFGSREQYTLTPLVRDLDYGECPTFREAITQVRFGPTTDVIVDLSGTEFLDASGLGLLLLIAKLTTELEGRLVVVTNERVNNILAVTRLKGIFITTSAKEEAIALLTDQEPA